MSKQSYSFAYGPLKIKGELDPMSTTISAKYSIFEDSYGDRIIGEKSTSLLDSEPFVYSGEEGTFTSTLGLQGTAIMAHVEGDIYDTTLAIIEKIGDVELEPF
ncbi:hypothetical protein N7519_004477 [Penicillium mononematosum]|uniref:uncharacterized protein n=1 Tax=Penicillium mononematosum TaxID=268346 RepID=UPI0025495E8A|nr:uncharacterized protein N7519_004477 [Penicillium mononematosum]KAJ6189569.1 hypothetical protein N7519_004477 [Penicillium mononematosum]